MTAQVSGATIQYMYQLLKRYTLDFNVKTQGLSSIVTDEKADFTGITHKRNGKRSFSRTNPFRIYYAFDNYGSTDYDTNGFEEPGRNLNWLGQ